MTLERLAIWDNGIDDGQLPQFRLLTLAHRLFPDKIRRNPRRLSAASHWQFVRRSTAAAVCVPDSVIALLSFYSTFFIFIFYQISLLI